MAGEERHPQHLAVGERASLLRRESSASYPSESHHQEEYILRRERDLSPTSTVGSHHEWDSGQWKTIGVLLMGVFLVNSDSAVALAMFRQIASDLDRLSSSSWVITAYLLGLISARPLCEKLSDICGRKSLLLIAYACYCMGGLLAGSGFSFWGILLGRGICGIGNAGITVLSSILIVDLVPVREVALWEGSVYAISQAGRAIGPFLGSLMGDGADWRWALLYQVPYNVVILLFIWRKMSFPATPTVECAGDLSLEGSRRSKLKRIDFSGTISLALANVALLLFFDRLQKKPNSIGHELSTLVPMSVWLGFLAVFVLVEGFRASEPIFPLQLLAHRNVVSSYAIQFFQTGAQLAFYTSVPLYFQVTDGDSPTKAATRLLITTLGTVAGGLCSGLAIERTNRHRLITTTAITLSNLGFLAIFPRWRGATGWAETLYAFPIGAGFGASLTSAYVGLTALLEPFQVAAATSGFYLCLHLGGMVGVGVASMLVATFVERELRGALGGLGLGGEEVEGVVGRVMASFEGLEGLEDDVGRVVRGVYAGSLVNVWLFSLVFGSLALLASFVMREGELDRNACSRRRPSEVCGYDTFRPGETREV